MLQALLIDWASAVPPGAKPLAFCGTTHYAAGAVLEQLLRGKVPIPEPSHDLESLVYTIFDLTRVCVERPDLLIIPTSNISDIMKRWQEECRSRSGLYKLVLLARECKYQQLREAFLDMDCAPSLSSSSSS